MGRHIFPRGDNELEMFTATILSTLSAQPDAYGIPPEELARLAHCQQEFEHWLGIARSAHSTSIAVALKNESRSALKEQARRLLTLVRGQPDLPSERLQALGLRPHRRRSTATNDLQHAPRLCHISTDRTAVEFWVRRSDIIKLGRPEGAIGAMVWTWTGMYPPPDIRHQWSWAGNFNRRRVRIDFGLPLATGGQAWIAAAWIDRCARVGPVSRPLNLAVPGLSLAQQVHLGLASAPGHLLKAA